MDGYALAAVVAHTFEITCCHVGRASIFSRRGCCLISLQPAKPLFCRWTRTVSVSRLCCGATPRWDTGSNTPSRFPQLEQAGDPLRRLFVTERSSAIFFNEGDPRCGSVSEN